MLINRAIQIGTPRAWNWRAPNRAVQVRENPFLDSYLDERFELELTMDRVRRHQRATGRLPDKRGSDPSIQRLYAFVAMLGEVFPRLSAGAQNALAGRVRGGLTDDIGVESIAFEMLIGSHLLTMGFDIEWHDLEHDGGYDLLITKDGLEAEVECKTFSGDIGRQIHKRRLFELGGLINESVSGAFRRTGSTSIEVKIPSRLNGGDIPMIAEQVKQALEAGSDFAGPQPCEIIIRPLEIDGSPFNQDGFPPNIDQDIVQEFVHERFGYHNPQVLLQMHAKRAVMLVILQSRLQDTVVDSIYRQLKKGARQFSGGRPAILCAHMLDMSASQLLELEKAPTPSNLDKIATDLLRAPHRGFLHTVTFSVPGIVQYRREREGRIVRNHRREMGPIYTVQSPDHPLKDDRRLQIFS